MIRAVLFDAVGTLIYPEPDVGAAYWTIGRRSGSRRSVEEIRQRFRDVLRRYDAIGRADVPRAVPPTLPATAAPPQFRSTSPAGERLRWRNIVSDVLDDVVDADAAFESLWRHFAQPEHWRVYDDVAPAWAQLADAGLLLGIASNFDDRLDPLCRSLPPLPRAAAVFHSAGLGFAKPDPRFYAEAASRLDLRPDQIVLVGDEPEHDYHAARAAGWHAVWLDRKACQLASPPAIRATTLLEAVQRICAGTD